MVYDPFYKPVDGLSVENQIWPAGLDQVDFLIFTCPLTPDTQHMFNDETLAQLKPGVRVVNVSRGPVIKESALLKGLKDGTVYSAALDCLLYTSPSPRDATLSRMPSSA